MRRLCKSIYFFLQILLACYIIIYTEKRTLSYPR